MKERINAIVKGFRVANDLYPGYEREEDGARVIINSHDIEVTDSSEIQRFVFALYRKDMSETMEEDIIDVYNILYGMLKEYGEEGVMDYGND